MCSRGEFEKRNRLKAQEDRAKPVGVETKPTGSKVDPRAEAAKPKT